MRPCENAQKTAAQSAYPPAATTAATRWPVCRSIERYMTSAAAGGRRMRRTFWASAVLANRIAESAPIAPRAGLAPCMPPSDVVRTPETSFTSS